MKNEHPITVLVIAVLASLVFASPANARPSLSNLQAQIDRLQQQIDNIQLIPGPTGPQGSTGPAGSSCSALQNPGSATISCDDGSMASVFDGAGGNKPQLYVVRDLAIGCPGNRAAEQDLLVQVFTTQADSSVVVVDVDMIRRANGRADIYLYVNGEIVTRTLTYTSSVQWESATIHWAENLAAGTHTISIRSPQADVWGCGPSWGGMTTMVFE